MASGGGGYIPVSNISCELALFLTKFEGVLNGTVAGNASVETDGGSAVTPVID